MSSSPLRQQPTMPPIIFDFVAGEVVVVDNPKAWLRWCALVGAQVKP